MAVHCVDRGCRHLPGIPEILENMIQHRLAIGSISLTQPPGADESYSLKLLTRSSVSIGSTTEVGRVKWKRTPSNKTASKREMLVDITFREIFQDIRQWRRMKRLRVANDEHRILRVNEMQIVTRLSCIKLSLL